MVITGQARATGTSPRCTSSRSALGWSLGVAPWLGLLFILCWVFYEPAWWEYSDWAIFEPAVDEFYVPEAPLPRAEQPVRRGAGHQVEPDLDIFDGSSGARSAADSAAAPFPTDYEEGKWRFYFREPTCHVEADSEDDCSDQEYGYGLCEWLAVTGTTQGGEGGEGAVDEQQPATEEDHIGHLGIHAAFPCHTSVHMHATCTCA